ncbi:MAG: acylphosphatase, partial [Bacteroidota bacterium]|nr:acylphosphatase [Bacteroidota bacterium]
MIEISRILSGPEPLRTVLIHVSGKVQGVHFRESTRGNAISLNIKGSVMNLNDGRVKILAQGSSDAIGQLIVWCKSGPPLARVDHVSVEETEVT